MERAPKTISRKVLKGIVPHEVLLRRVRPRTGDDLTPRWTLEDGVKPSEGLRRAAQIFEFMEGLCEIRKKDGTFGPFRMNSIQIVLAQYVAWCWHNNVICWILLPKSRQMGSSTFWELFSYASCELFPGYRVALVAHNEQGAHEIFGKTVTVRDRLARNNPDWFPELTKDQEGHYEWAHGSAKEAGTIRTGDALGKGGSLNMIHYSESANFADKGNKAHEALESLAQACARGPYMVVVHESTAKGRDPVYYPLCMKAIKPHSRSQFKLIFLPWFLEPNYSMRWEDYRHQIVAKGGMDPGEKFVMTAEEELLKHKLANAKVKKTERHHRYRWDLTNDQLVWRRWCIENNCDGKLESFWRYYPSFLDEAFVASQDCKWSARDVKHYRDRGEKPLEVGRVDETAGKYLWIPDPVRGQVKIWEHPRKGASYVIGADIGGEKNESDYYSAYVANKATREVVAHLYGHFEWDDFADRAVRLAYYFNTAMLVPENNVKPAVSKRMHRRAYPNLHYHTDDVVGPAVSKTPGFNTNKKTRPEILDVLDKAIRDKNLIMPDVEFASEMENFVWHPKESNPMQGQYAASAGNYDDRIMSAAITVFFCDDAEELSIRQTEPVKKPSRIIQEFLEMIQAENAQDALEEGYRVLKLGANGNAS